VGELLAEKVELADDEESEYRASIDRNFHDAQKQLNHIFDTLHLPYRGAVRALNELVVVNPLILIITAPAVLPVDLQNLIPHAYQREDGRDAACGSKEDSGAKGELIRGWYHIYIVRGALSQGRRRAFRLRAD
jgi:hypothetical protein